MKRLAAVAVAVVSLGACDPSVMAPETAEAPAYTLETSSNFTNPSGKTLAGGLNIWGFCNSQGYPTVGYARGWIEGPQYAYNNWVCQTGSDQLNPENPHPVNMTKACQWQHGMKAIQAHPDDPDHAWSWKCWVSKPAK